MTPKKSVPEKYISIVVKQHAKTNGNHCLFCQDHEVQENKNYYDIEIRTKKINQAKAIVVLLAFMAKEFDGNYNRLTTIHISLCEIHYCNTFAKIISPGQDTMVDFEDIRQIFDMEMAHG